MEQEVKKSPVWKQAVDDFLLQGFKAGDILTKEWLLKHFELSEPSGNVEAYKRFSLKWMAYRESFRDELLERCICLKTMERTGGFLVLPPHQQTKHGLGILVDGIRKAFRQGGRVVRYVNQDQLNDQQRKENADAVVKIASLQAMTNPKKWLGEKAV